MRDLFSDTEKYWYSLVSVAPKPETGEFANVGVLFGNGKAFRLSYKQGLPRLAGIAAKDEINVYEAVLASVAEQISRGLSMDHVRAMIGPQLIAAEPRTLYEPLTDLMIAGITRRFLTRPQTAPSDEGLERLLRVSGKQLQQELVYVRPKGVEIVAKVRPNRLYEGTLEKHVPFAVPELSRAVRGARRDVLIGSLLIDPQFNSRSIRTAAGNFGWAFHAYDKFLRDSIRIYALREIRIVGVIQPSHGIESPEIRLLREHVHETWRIHAKVIQGDENEVREQLRENSDWAAMA